MRQIEKHVYQSYLNHLSLPHIDNPIAIVGDDLFQMPYDLFLFDGFGTLYLNDCAMPGAINLWNSLKDKGRKVALLTNSASRSSTHIAQSARNLKFLMDDRDVFSSGDFFQEQCHELQGQNVFHLGSRHGEEFLKAHHIQLCDCPTAPIVVISGPIMDTAILRDRFLKALDILQRGKGLVYLLNPDACAPRSDGSKWEVSGAYAWKLQQHTDCKIKYFGKPFPPIYHWVAQKTNLDNSKILMIGDTLGTDIAGARAAGIKSALCIQGNSRFDKVFDDMKTLNIKPDFLLSFSLNIPHKFH